MDCVLLCCTPYIFIFIRGEGIYITFGTLAILLCGSSFQRAFESLASVLQSSLSEPLSTVDPFITEVTVSGEFGLFPTGNDGPLSNRLERHTNDVLACDTKCFFVEVKPSCQWSPVYIPLQSATRTVLK